MTTATALVVDPGASPGSLAADVGERTAAAVHDVLVRRTVEQARAAADRVEVADTAAAIAGLGSGPFLVLPAICPRLGPGHLAAALADLAAGCDVAYGPTLDADWYLAALREPRLELLAATPFALAREYAIEIGLLRHERALRTGADAAAFLVDPLTPPDVRAALRVS